MMKSMDFSTFIHASPSAFHAADTVARYFSEHSFQELDEKEVWSLEPGAYYTLRDGAIIAWFIPEGAGSDSAFRIVGSHTDSPGFKLKPEFFSRSHGFVQANVEVYGGPILASWFDRELEFAGVVVDADGSQRLVRTGPVARIPHLAIHLSRSEELRVDKQVHTQPVFALDIEGDSVEDLLGGAVAWDLVSVDAQPPRVFGVNGDFFASGRLDNLSSVYPSMRAFVQACSSYAGRDILVCAAFNHEEVGSASISGAAGPFLEDVLSRILLSLGVGCDERRAIFARSFCVSADAAHSVHPNYASMHDSHVFPVLGGGSVLKVNANQRYASSAVTGGYWLSLLESRGIASQKFVGNNSVPCGSTIGPISATRLGIPTVDVGIPLLSMHSAREMCSLYDVDSFFEALCAFYLDSK